MRALFVVPPHPVSNDAARVVERLKHVLPDTVFFETAEEPFDNPILFRRIGRDELLLQPIVPTRLPEALALKDQPIVAPEDGRLHWTQRPEALQTRRFDRPFRLLRSTAECKLIPDHFPIVTVDHRREMRPAILPTGNMRHIHGPAFVTAIRPTRPALHPRAWRRDTVMHTPPLLFQDPIHRLAIDDNPILHSQQYPQPPIPTGGLLLNQLV